MGSEESAGMSEMNVSMDGIIGKAALEELSESYSSASSDLLTSKGNSETHICGGNPATYCECMSVQLQKAELEKQKTGGHQHHHHHQHEKESPDPTKPGNDENEGDLSDPKVEMHCSPVCCSPPESPAGSVEEILEDFESDEIEEVLEEESPEEAEEEEDDGGPDASL